LKEEEGFLDGELDAVMDKVEGEGEDDFGEDGAKVINLLSHPHHKP
jgi:hypothetical protein